MSRDHRHIVGVRFRDSSRVHFFSVDDPEVAVGTWVVVPVAEGDKIARVVVAPMQIVDAQVDEQPFPVLRVLKSHDAEFARRLQEGSPGTGQGGEKRLIGGLGPAAPSTSSPASSEASYEDQHYRKMKQGVPMPGEQVDTPDGQGIIANLDVFKGLVTVRYDDPAGEQTYPVDDVIRLDSATTHS